MKGVNSTAKPIEKFFLNETRSSVRLTERVGENRTDNLTNDIKITSVNIIDNMLNLSMGER